MEFRMSSMDATVPSPTAKYDVRTFVPPARMLSDAFTVWRPVSTRATSCANSDTVTPLVLKFELPLTPWMKPYETPAPSPSPLQATKSHASHMPAVQPLYVELGHVVVTSGSPNPLPGSNSSTLPEPFMISP